MVPHTEQDPQGWAAGVSPAVASWFVEEGWQLEPAALRAELEQRGAGEDDVVMLVDEGAERRAAAAEAPQARAQLSVTPAEYVLGALLLSGAYGADVTAKVLERVDATGLMPEMFERGRDELVYRAIVAVAMRGAPAEFMLVEDELRRQGALERAGGIAYVRALSQLAPAVENAPHYAGLIVTEARRGTTEKLGLALAEAARNGGVSAELRATLIEILDRPLEGGPPVEAVDGGAFVFDEPTDLALIRLWGDETAIAWSAGEGLMLLGADGVGKTTLGQQLALCRAGQRAALLGMAVVPDERRVLYIAADRPRQAARSMRRMVGDLDRATLAERLTVWRGPLPAMLNEDRTILARLARQFDAGTVIVDSLKDVAVDVGSDEAGGRIAACFQHLIAVGVELLVLHHPRKPGGQGLKPARSLAEAYGSRLIYGVMGSVISLYGDPGDAYIDLRHLKQPVDDIGALKIHHDHKAGFSSIEKGTDLVDLVLAAGAAGTTAAAVAGISLEKDAPTRSDIGKVRKHLDRLVERGELVRVAADERTAAARYVFNGPAEALQR